ncbi:MAG TPA: pitrilysin family protein [Candidatus Binatia bacterium]|nr:pitrilysin family protein [Candidatus Binatia bacterium]
MLVTLAVAVPAASAPPSRPIEVTKATLSNGLRIVVLRDRLAPVVSTFLNYQAGADDESITGLAHASEHMMFRGSKTLSASQFAEITAIVGGSYNANTQSEITQYFFTVPSRDLDIALHLEASRARELLMSQPLWDQERGAIEQEVTRDNSDAGYRLYVQVLHHLFEGTPYADEGLGTLESFGNQINAPQLQAFYRTWYHPNNAIYVIAGDVDPQQAIAKIRALFGSIPAAKLPARKPVHLQPLTPATFSDQTDQSQTEAFVAYRFPGYESPDYAASKILIGALNNRRGDLYALVAAGKAISASADAQAYPKAGMASVDVSVNATVDPQNALADLRGVVDGYRAHGVPSDLIEAAKQRAIARAQFARNSASGLAREWSQALAVEHRTPDDDLAAIRRVTPADVNRVLRTYLMNATATSAYAVPKTVSSASPAANAAADQSGGPGAPENNAVTPQEGTQLPSWARGLLTNIRVPQQTLHPTAMTLSNGIKLIVQPESISDTVTVRGLIRNNPSLEEPPNREGVAELTSSLMSYGTATYDRVAFARQLDAIAANVDTGLSFSLSVVAPQFERGIQLLADGELHPALPQSSFDVVKSRAYRSAQAREHSPSYLASVALANALYPAGDPARRRVTAASIDQITLDDVKAWYASAYRPDLATIVVVGNVTPARARAVVERWFGAWKANGPAPLLDPSPVPNNAAAAFTIPAFGRVQSSVTLAQTLQLRRGDADVAALRVANTVLSGGTFASMLYHDLRVVNGLVYSVGGSLNIGKTRSTFSINYGSAPGDVDRAQALALDDVRQLQTAQLPLQRLNRAKALLMASLPLRIQSVTGIAGELLGNASEGLPLDQGYISARRELAAGPADVQQAIARWIRPNDFVRVVQGPEQAK